MVKARPSGPLIFIKGKLNGHHAFGMIDTGATLSAVSAKFINSNKLHSMCSPCEHHITLANNSSINMQEEVKNAIFSITDTFGV